MGLHQGQQPAGVLRVQQRSCGDTVAHSKAGTSYIFEASNTFQECNKRRLGQGGMQGLRCGGHTLALRRVTWNLRTTGASIRALWGALSYRGIYRLPGRPCHPAMTHSKRPGAMRTAVSQLHAPHWSIWCAASCTCVRCCQPALCAGTLLSGCIVWSSTPHIRGTRCISASVRLVRSLLPLPC